MSKISAHVIDLVKGSSAHGMNVLLEFLAHDGWQDLEKGVTDTGGEIKEFFVSESSITPGIYRMSFDTKSYMKAAGKHRPYPYVPVVFEINDSEDTYEISLMLSATGSSNNIEVSKSQG